MGNLLLFLFLWVVIAATACVSASENSTSLASTDNENIPFDPRKARRRLKKHRNHALIRNVDPTGFDWYSPWASGLTLRPPATPFNKCCGTLIVYVITPSGTTTTSNINFYLVAMVEAYSAKVTFTNYYFHSFVANGPLNPRTLKLLGQLRRLLPPHHGFEVVNATTAFDDGRKYKTARQIGYAVGRMDVRRFASVAVLTSKSVGPFFAPYWDGSAGLWPDAYTIMLSDDVRAVGSTLTCPAPEDKLTVSAEKYVPYFDGPVVVDREGLRLAMATSFEFFRGRFTFALLISGYNIRSMHGQPHETDWRRSLKNPLVGGLCTTEIAHIAPHPYESLFLHRNQKLANGFEKVYMKSVRKSSELLLAPPVFENAAEPPPAHSPTDRLLVVYAYYEKTAQYKENLLFFLKAAVYPDSVPGAAGLVDYVVVVNGNHTVHFPNLSNLKIIQRNNTCLDFGSWGVALEKCRSPEHSHFFLVNGSVKGPFLPDWFQGHWSKAFILRLRGDIGVVGLSVNCPDGVGRGIPHVMSMAVMFDRRVMKLADEKGLFSCVESYEVGLKRESDFSVAIMEAGYNLASMQTSQLGVDFRKNYKAYLLDKDNIKAGCSSIGHDVFFQEGWYHGMSPNPMEFVFMKVSRDVSANTTDAIGNLVLENTRYAIGHSMTAMSTTAHVLLLMHSLDMDGAPRLLFEMGSMLVEMGYKVTFAAFDTGAMAEHITTAGASLVILDRHSAGTVQNLLSELYNSFDLIVFNTVVWADMIGAQTYVRAPHPKLVWLIHEGELHPSTGIEGRKGGKKVFWYGKRFKSIGDQASQRNTLQKVDKVVFVADKVRSLWGNYDTGHFETFRGFVNIADVEQRALSGLSGDSRKKLLESVHADEHTFIMSTVGTVCKRKNQLILVQALEGVGGAIFGKRPYILLIIGAPSPSGGRGDDDYFQLMKEYVEAKPDLKKRIWFIPFSNDALGYLALSHLHLSVSVSEAFPLNVLEAMALGVPAMVTPAGGSEEAFIRPGVDGLLLPNVGHDVSKLQKGLVDLLEGRLRLLPAIGAEGKKTLLRKYTDTAARVRLKGLVDRTLHGRDRGYNGNVCIVVRSFAGHLTDPIFSLRNMLQSLIDQEYPHWTAFVANTDPKPMEGLYSLLADLGDHRLHVVDPPEPEEFVLGSFAVTDRIVAEQCPPDSDWLLVTNGDNHYEPQFLNHLDLRKDVVAFDFYSRYTHILDTAVVGDGCNKFFAGSKLVCKKNLLKNWHTDLGSYVINYKRWMLEGRTFLPLDREQDGAADGYAMESMVYYDWQVKLVDQSKGCLYSHSPNMYYCLNNSHTDSALWDASRNTCVYDEASITQLKRTHVPYIYTDLPNSMAMFQGRCMDMRS